MCGISSSGLMCCCNGLVAADSVIYMDHVVPAARCMHSLCLCVATGMDASPPQDVSIIDKDESSDKAYHVVDGYVIEDSKTPFPVGVFKWKNGCGHGTRGANCTLHKVFYSPSLSLPLPLKNGQLSFVPEDYGKEMLAAKRARTHPNREALQKSPAPTSPKHGCCVLSII